MKKSFLWLTLFSGICFAKPQVYFGADALSNSGGYSVQHGIYFPVNQDLDFGYDIDFTQWNRDVHSFGLNIKPAFRKQQFYLAPIVGLHYFSGDIDSSYSLGAEVGCDFERVTIRAGYKDVNDEFVDNDAFYVGAAIRFD